MYLPAGDDTMSPRLSSGVGESTVLSWLQRNEDGATLRYSTLGIGEWSEAIDVVTDPDMFTNWADLPSVTPLDDKHWVSHWLSKSGAETYAYDVLFAQSTDGGKTWGEPVRPHTDGTPTEHGFVSLYAAGTSTALLWLDGRQTGNEAAGDPAANGMTLRSAVIDPQNGRSNEQLVDGLVCDCCQTDVAISSKGPIAVYRNRSVEEIRDIYVTRFADGRWQPGVAIADDGWSIAGCPVNGPAIDADGEFVAIAWFSAADGNPIVRAILSTDAGRSFADPLVVSSASTSGHVDVTIIDSASAAISWVESAGQESNDINVRVIGVGGHAGPITTVGRSELVRIHPKMTRWADTLVVAWTMAANDSTRIATALVPIHGIRPD